MDGPHSVDASAMMINRAGRYNRRPAIGGIEGVVKVTSSPGTNSLGVV